QLTVEQVREQRYQDRRREGVENHLVAFEVAVAFIVREVHEPELNRADSRELPAGADAEAAQAQQGKKNEHRDAQARRGEKSGVESRALDQSRRQCPEQ